MREISERFQCFLLRFSIFVKIYVNSKRVSRAFRRLLGGVSEEYPEISENGVYEASGEYKRKLQGFREVSRHFNAFQEKIFRPKRYLGRKGV